MNDECKKLEKKVIAAFKKMSKAEGYEVKETSLSRLQIITGYIDKRKLCGLGTWNGKISVSFTHGLEIIRCDMDK